METLPLTWATPNKRPKRPTDVMIRDAATKVAAELDDTVGDKAEIADDIARVAIRYGTNLDGYELARELERNHHWSCDMNIAETLDNFQNWCSTAVDDAVKQWAAENPMEPPFPIGAVVKTVHGIGPIEAVYEYRPHSYIVVVDDSRLIIAFEDVSAVETTT